MSPPTSGPALREWLIARLDPVDAESVAGGPMDSDFGLQPPPPDKPLKPAAVLVGLVERPHGLTVILTRRADTLRSHTGQVAFPGGRCDPGEPAWLAALREAEEEIGLDPERVEPLGLASPYRTGTGYHVTPVVALVRTPFDLAPNPDEVAHVFEPPFALLMDLAAWTPHEGRAPSGEIRRYHALTWEGQLIWGATAGMLRALRGRLFEAPSR